jgi:hypothetical protein
MQPGRERRRFSRKAKRLAVRYGAHDTDRLGFTRNVSADGLFLQGRTILPRGAPVRLELECGDRTLGLLGLVAWTDRASSQSPARESGMGIQLLRPPRELLGLLAE